MSGITPLLDTLLHQVLGPKGDISAQKQLNQPVRNVEPGEGPRALQSDSRTDSRPNSQAHAILSQGKYAIRGYAGKFSSHPRATRHTGKCLGATASHPNRSHNC